jgi:hypothetical protein
MKKIILFACSLVLIGAGCASSKPTTPEKVVDNAASNVPAQNNSKNTSTSSAKAEEQQLRDTFGKAGRPATPEEIEKMNSEEKTVCEKSGGSWKAFTGCNDICMYERAPALRKTCGSAKTYGCDCGADKCWTGTRCEKN